MLMEPKSPLNQYLFNTNSMLEISNRELKVTGIIELEKDLELGKEYTFSVTGEVVKEELRNAEHDGTFAKRFVLKVQKIQFWPVLTGTFLWLIISTK